ncbi:MAG TPA: MFS transporter [Syntrophorhabdaceae bacterium]|nr:MFS transporter [Syntrophorhabdaceae bacterium]HOL06430.1 MFS transporter [Syntrophorhabdaceae bacterium]HON85438.1 MFS transporter [Syntrophorhabdaceae bacterium]HOT41441.1 MFS transporter [Syntrophorhabdaceae bacterium]HPP42745.1 MFS transporter [Syntrophorhabdaceae bacterium]
MERYKTLKGKGLAFLFFLWFLWFINFSIRIAFSPILPLVEDEFSISHGKASSIFIFLSAGYGVGVLASGLFSGRVGYKRSIITSLLLLSIVTFLIPFVYNFSLLYLFSFLLGFSVGIYLPAAIPLITEYYSEKQWGKAISIHDTGASAAIFATPLISIFLLYFFKWRDMFMVYGVFFLLCAVIFYFVSREVKISNPPRAIFKEIIKRRALWLQAILWIFVAGANLGIYSITPLYLTKELKMNISFANTILAISRLGSIGVAVACGFIVDKFNLRYVILIMVFITSIFTILLGTIGVKYIAFVLFFQAIFVTGFFPIGLVAIARIFDRKTRSLATGIILALSILFGGGLIPYFLGVSGDLYSFGLGIVILGVLVMLSSTLLFHIKELE